MTGVRERSTDAQVRHLVWEALSTVIDPELDEPITALDFVRVCEVTQGDVRVRLRLPT
ncbi:MAG: iron-sulfur cluster assembly protein, partial [Actinomycetia bacterium]|nr:iron-sulfur cluster assembly protein [Actinomycetes bacterium]